MAIVDYISGTVPAEQVDRVLSCFGPYSDVWVEARGAHGYRSCWACEGFRVYYDGTPAMGVYLQVSGEGCRRITEYCGVENIAAVVSELRGFSFRATRVDLAFDSRSEAISAQRAYECYQAGEVRTHWRRNRDASEYADGRQVSCCWYAGKIDSEVSLCCYDKRLEQISRGNLDPGPWTRFELRFRGERAGVVLNWIVEHAELSGAEGLLSSAIEFVMPVPDASLRDWPRAAWWSGFLADAAKLRLSVKKVRKPFAERARQWARMHGPTLAMLTLVMCGGVLYGDWVRDTIVDGSFRLSKIQRQDVVSELGYSPGILGMSDNKRGRVT